jgi:UDP-N-acetylmuramyl pentapeptide phosphotransferase/UDP-N-acetylglucosamine-1-phosphate transferase
MDGINGILGLYSFIVLLFCLSYSGLFAYASGFYAVLFALLGFLVFNFRKKALMFAGDVGSLSLAYLICMALYSMDFQRVLVVDKASSVLFMFFPVSIFMADSFTTILHRIWLRENIFKSHRFHLYQLLTPHLINSQTRVSLIYAISQYLVLHIGMFIEKNVLNLLVYYIMLVVSFMILRLIITTKISTLQTSN